MFKAQKGFAKEDVIIIDPYWNEDNIESLRNSGRNNDLTCPVCKQPVLVKAGKKKRWHFSHKDLTDCPLKNESPNVLQARMLLYSLLKSKLSRIISIEKYFPESNLPRPIDCYVELSNEHKIGYWILEKGIRERLSLQQEFSKLGISIIWVPLAGISREDDLDPKAVHLTPTERDISYPSEYNNLYSRNNRSLSYLDVESNHILTLRGLNCIHSPQKYHFDFKLITILDQILLSPKTGEFVHPGEHEQLEQLKKEIEEQERLRAIEEEKRRDEEKKWRQEIENQNNKILSYSRDQRLNKEISFTESPSHTLKNYKNTTKESSYINNYNKQYTCIICGKTTTNWISLETKNNTCICSNECLIISNKRGQIK